MVAFCRWCGFLAFALFVAAAESGDLQGRDFHAMEFVRTGLVFWFG